MSHILKKIQVLINSEKVKEAEDLAWVAYSQNKKNTKILKTLGLTLLMQQKYIGALDIYLQCAKMANQDFDVLNNIAHLFLKIEEFKKAEEYALDSFKIKPEAYQPLITLAEINLRKRNFDMAYQNAVEIQKRITFEMLIVNHQTLFLVLDIFLANNKTDEAVNLINYCYSKKFVPEVFYYHVGLSFKSITPELIQSANLFIKNSKFKNHITKAKTLAPVYFGLGRYHLKDNQLLSDMNFIQGNSEIAGVQRFRPLESQKHLKQLKKIFIDDLYKPDISEEDGSNLIFVTGMPRSGTTLLESIVSSSGEVHSCGELTSLSDLFGHYADPDKDKSEEIEDRIFGDEEEGKRYLRRVNFLNEQEGKKFVLDKLPGNYFLIGFIKKRFPKAKVLYIKRNAWDNAISLYQQFYVSQIPYAATFFNISVAYANHEEIIRFWQDDLMLDFMTVNYEELVSNTTEVANRVFKYCGFEKKYDDKFREGFFSRTASKNQVRGEIHKKSIKKLAFEQQRHEFEEYLQSQRDYWQIS